VTDLAGATHAGRRLPSPTRLAGRLLDLAFPARCSGCGAEGPPVCEDCRPGLLARIDAPGGVLLGLPGDVPSPLLQLEWCAPFEGVVRSALHDLKYAGERRLGPVLGEALSQRWRRVGAGGDLLVPVPIHRDRERERGYDQAVLLARAAAAGLGLPVEHCLERYRATIPQFQLDRAHRATNVADAFRVRRGTEALLAARWVLLIDDVATTGSTLAACARVLLGAGARAVSALTVARER
jgi:ComF family protein